MKWTVHLKGGPMRVNHAAVLIGDKIYSFGGYSSSDQFKDWQPIPVHILDTTTMRWAHVHYKQEGDNVPLERYGHSAVAYGDKVYLWGGRNNTVQCEIFSCFDTKTLEWSNPQVTGEVPYAKDGHSACLIGNKMYIFGGFEYYAERYSQDVHYLNLDTMEWTFIEPDGYAPPHRDFHSAVVIGDRMYIYGGRGDLNNPYNAQEEMYFPDLMYLDTTKNEWVSANPRGTWPNPRRSHSAWLHDGYMYIFGGFDGLIMTNFNDIWRYSVAENKWQYWPVNGNPPSERRRQACIICDNKMFLFGGTSPCTGFNPVTPGLKTAEPSLRLEGDMEVPLPNIERLVNNDDMHILDMAPTLSTLAICAILENKLDRKALPWLLQMEIGLMTVPNRISIRRKRNQTGY